MGNGRISDLGMMSLVGTAIFTTVLDHRLSSTETELYSEIVCWIILPFAHKIISRAPSKHQHEDPWPERQVSGHASSVYRWIVALGVAIASLYKTEFGLVELFPALTPLLILVQTLFRPRFGLQQKPDSSFLSFLGFTLSGTTLVAVLSIWALLGCDLRKMAPCVVALVALLAVYVVLLPRNLPGVSLPPAIDLDHDMPALALTVVFTLIGALGIQIAILGMPKGQPMQTLASGVLKSLCWCFVLKIAEQSTWQTTTAIGSFGIMATRDLARLSSELQAVAHVLASTLTLAQIVGTMPKRSRASLVLWLFSLFSVLPYLMNALAILAEKRFSFVHTQHPIEAWYQQAQTRFWSLTHRQSSRFEMASAEYRRRYGLEPPPGFDRWYKFAVLKKAPIIDSYDMIHHAISPFLSISGEEVNRIMLTAFNDSNSELWLCHFSGGDATTRCQHAYRSYDRHISTLFDALVGNLPGQLPDVKFLVNHLDEPRVLLPGPTAKPPSPQLDSWKLTDMSHQPTWKTLTKSCGPTFAADTPRRRQRPSSFGLPFVKDEFAKDVCQHPEYENMHGLFQSPTSMKLIEGMVPVLSTGSPSIMGDILFPSPAYMESEFEYSPQNDAAWEKKRNQLYWTGSNTGGVAQGNTWRSFHRQRFVELVRGGRSIYHYLRPGRGGYFQRVSSSFLNGRLYNVAFTRIFQCQRPLCRDQRVYFGTRSWEHKDQALKSRLVFDLDGNGISGRFYKLLASKSLPLKQTILREWHDDRLVPWLHYIPVSQSMSELPEIVRYLTSTKRGREVAKDIAQRGQETREDSGST
ncbi:hypothetical protein HIM_05645 [Hirsutella minnesotensis 3608]|uniref:Glycosyl transferase CAP10 domain-containing protein n=1 Tax=Hirsutella minnesotensis 3608 TaxID=1043627 RepID=A0A0F8A590_9HYPO|nr:hypothetical protein HIM_05645 [Hirsutella minnesotensis 3608]